MNARLELARTGEAGRSFAISARKVLVVGLGCLFGLAFIGMWIVSPPDTARHAGPLDPASSAFVALAPTLVPFSTQPATVAAAVVASVPVYLSPTAVSPGQQLANPNNLGAPLVFLAVAREESLIEVDLPERPNGSMGWVPLADVRLVSDPFRISIGLSARELTVYDGDAPKFSTSVAPGEPSSPTPTGSFYVTEVIKVADSGSAYGPYALGTSAFSDTYQTFDGGPGQIAIHGTNQPWLIGQFASHGCVRLTNSAITTVAQQVPAGTPIDIGP